MHGLRPYRRLIACEHRDSSDNGNERESCFHSGHLVQAHRLEVIAAYGCKRDEAVLDDRKPGAVRGVDCVGRARVIDDSLLAQLGDYVNVGANTISLVDANSFWVDGYFEETNITPIRVGDPAQIKLMGNSQIVRGHVDSVARAINVANAQPNGQGVANVNPIFTWVRLAQRIPIRIRIDHVSPGIVLVAGMTATVQIDVSPR